MKTCETCKWYREKRVDDYGLCCVEPPVLWRDNEMSAEVRHFHRCSKWETKLERKCGNCEFFAVSDESNECRREPPDFDGDFPATDYDQWCGSFKGKE